MSLVSLATPPSHGVTFLYHCTYQASHYTSTPACLSDFWVPCWFWFVIIFLFNSFPFRCLVCEWWTAGCRVRSHCWSYRCPHHQCTWKRTVQLTYQILSSYQYNIIFKSSYYIIHNEVPWITNSIPYWHNHHHNKSTLSPTLTKETSSFRACQTSILPKLNSRMWISKGILNFTTISISINNKGAKCRRCRTETNPTYLVNSFRLFSQIAYSKIETKGNSSKNNNNWSTTYKRCTYNNNKYINHPKKISRKRKTGSKEGPS